MKWIGRIKADNLTTFLTLDNINSLPDSSGGGMKAFSMEADKEGQRRLLLIAQLLNWTGDYPYRLNSNLRTAPKTEAETVKTWTDSGVPLNSALAWSGKTDEEIASMEKDKQAEREANASAARNIAGRCESKARPI